MDWLHTYTNALGETLALRFYAADSVHADEREAEVALGRITGWSRASKTMELTLSAYSPRQRDKIQRVLGYDADAETMGTLAFNGWQASVRPVAISWTNWEQPWYRSRATVRLVCPEGVWRRVTSTRLEAGTASTIVVGGLDLQDPLGIANEVDLGSRELAMPDPPEFTLHPQDVSPVGASRHALACHALGYRVAYSWQKRAGGAWVAATDEGRDSSLLLLSPGVTGEYRCVATDAVGQSATSATATVRAGMTGDLMCDLGVLDLAPADGAPTHVADTSAREASWDGATGYYDGDGPEPGLDLGGTDTGAPVEVESRTGARLRVTFHGPCSDPYVTLGGNTYQVEATAARGELIVIDPLGRRDYGRSVYKRDRYGKTTSLFAKRVGRVAGSGAYAFETLPTGSLRASWPQEIDVDLDVIEEVGTPPWS